MGAVGRGKELQQVLKIGHPEVKWFGIIQHELFEWGDGRLGFRRSR